MSNIPEARRLLQEALDNETPHEHIREALKLLDRRRPAFVARSTFSNLSDEGKAEARRLRNDGLGIHTIAKMLHTTNGRVSEAINAIAA